MKLDTSIPKVLAVEAWQRKLSAPTYELEIAQRMKDAGYQCYRQAVVLGGIVDVVSFHDGVAVFTRPFTAEHRLALEVAGWKVYSQQEELPADPKPGQPFSRLAAKAREKFNRIARANTAK